MILMTPLEKEVLKYEKEGFKVDQKRSLKHGLRTILFKKGGFWGTDSIVYIYYVDGNATNDNLRECFKNYVTFYENNNLDSNDKGLFLCSGMADKKLFRDVRQAVIRDDEIRDSIRLVQVSESAENKLKEEKLKTESQSAKVSRLTNDETERIILKVGTKCCYPNCIETIALDVHHIVPLREGGTNREDNLIVLCPVHHRHADRGSIPRKRLEMHNVTRMEYKRL